MAWRYCSGRCEGEYPYPNARDALVYGLVSCSQCGDIYYMTEDDRATALESLIERIELLESKLNISSDDS